MKPLSALAPPQVAPAAEASTSPRLVILESPYAGDVEKNVAYARACLRDSLLRGEAPLASHLLYTQPGVLDDTIAEERALGIQAGLAWGVRAEATVVYTDLGISSGMLQGIERARRDGRTIKIRKIIVCATCKGSGSVWHVDANAQCHVPCTKCAVAETFALFGNLLT